MTTKEKEFSDGNRDQSYSCGQLPELEETKILSEEILENDPKLTKTENSGLRKLVTRLFERNK